MEHLKEAQHCFKVMASTNTVDPAQALFEIGYLTPSAEVEGVYMLFFTAREYRKDGPLFIVPQKA